MTATVKLITLAQNLIGTYGALVMNDNPLCVTVERPWLNNQNIISCIPRGITAHFIKYFSPKNGAVWICQDVSHRSDIEIHAANVPNQVEGCIGAGQYFADFMGTRGVANSQFTMTMLRKTLPDEFALIIA